MHTKFEKKTFEKIIQIMDELREQCPWDKKQTWESLRTLTIEEVYELSDAIIQKNYDKIKKELGDVFLHILFYSRIASEEGKFDINDVIKSLIEKLIFRHPHIYGNVKAETEEQVKQNWEKIKQTEKDNEGVLAGVPSSLPSVIKALRIQEKAAAVGFDWDNTQDVVDKVGEELEEFLEEVKISHNNKHKIEDELGDVFFALINVARVLKINPDSAIEMANQKFINRFNYIEKKLKENNKNFSEVDLNEMGKYWIEAKEQGL